MSPALRGDTKVRDPVAFGQAATGYSLSKISFRSCGKSGTINLPERVRV